MSYSYGKIKLSGVCALFVIVMSYFLCIREVGWEMSGLQICWSTSTWHHVTDDNVQYNLSSELQRWLKCVAVQVVLQRLAAGCSLCCNSDASPSRGGKGGKFSRTHDVWGAPPSLIKYFAICSTAKLIIWIGLTSVVSYCAMILQQIWVFLGWMDASKIIWCITFLVSNSCT